MDIIRTAERRINQREAERRSKERRAAEYRKALEVLEDQEHKANWPDNPKRKQEVERIRALRKEIGAMQDEEFGLSEQLRQLGD